MTLQIKPWHYVIAGGAILVLMGRKAADTTTSAIPTGEGTAPAPAGQNKITPGALDAYLAETTRAAARHSQLAGKHHILRGLLYHESRFDPQAVSGTGAAGIGQFTSIGRAEVRRLMAIPEWSGRYAGESTLATRLAGMTRTDAFDPYVGIEAAALLLFFRRNGAECEAARPTTTAEACLLNCTDAGSHAAAKLKLQALPVNQRSQSPSMRRWFWRTREDAGPDRRSNGRRHHVVS